MSCDSIERELVAYHFGLLDGAARAEVEAHLAACGACVRAFVLVKRAVELGDAPDVPAPSPRAKARLRRAVAAELGVVTARRWWERPVAFAVAASIVLGAGVATQKLTSAPGAPPYALRH